MLTQENKSEMKSMCQKEKEDRIIIKGLIHYFFKECEEDEAATVADSPGSVTEHEKKEETTVAVWQELCLSCYPSEMKQDIHQLNISGNAKEITKDKFIDNIQIGKLADTFFG